MTLVDGIAEPIGDACDSGAVTPEAQLRDLLDRLPRRGRGWAWPQ